MLILSKHLSNQQMSSNQIFQSMSKQNADSIKMLIFNKLI